MYFTDSSCRRVFKITTSTGILTTIAGSGVTGGYEGSFTGDGGQGTSATVNNPFGVDVSSGIF